MAQTQPCSHCGIPLPLTLTAACTACGTPLSRDFLDWRAATLSRIADRQRAIIWLFLINVVIQIGIRVTPFPAVPFFGISIMIVMAMLFVANVVFLVRLVSAQGTHIVVLILLSVLAIVPLVNLLVLLRVNSQSTATLRAAGIRVGFFGTSASEVKTVVTIGRCRQCDYDLTGLTAGRCPECGLIFNATSAAAAGAAPPKIA